MASQRHCYLCGSKYSYCDCDRQPAYMATFCSENCRDIFKSLCSFGAGMISAEDCKELLECCDLSKKDSYKESTINTINKVYDSVAPVEAPVEEVFIAPLVDDEPLAEEVVEATIPHRERKRKHEVVLDENQ